MAPSNTTDALKIVTARPHGQRFNRITDAAPHRTPIAAPAPSPRTTNTAGTEGEFAALAALVREWQSTVEANRVRHRHLRPVPSPETKPGSPYTPESPGPADSPAWTTPPDPLPVRRNRPASRPESPQRIAPLPAPRPPAESAPVPDVRRVTFDPPRPLPRIPHMPDMATPMGVTYLRALVLGNHKAGDYWPRHPSNDFVARMRRPPRWYRRITRTHIARWTRDTLAAIGTATILATAAAFAATTATAW